MEPSSETFAWFAKISAGDDTGNTQNAACEIVGLRLSSTCVSAPRPTETELASMPDEAKAIMGWFCQHMRPVSEVQEVRARYTCQTRIQSPLSRSGVTSRPNDLPTPNDPN